jgi:hypothetical protein
MKNEHILQIKLDELMNMSHRVAVMREGRVVNILNTPETTREEVLSSRISSAIPTMRAGFELQSIGAVVIGGTPLTGVLLLGIIANGLNLLHVEVSWQYVVTGSVIIFAVILHEHRAQ